MIPETHQAALDELLRSAGLPAAAGNTVDLLAESTNTVYVVQTGETDFILRVYGDSGWPEIYDRARLAKVIHLHEVLAAKGVSVPRILGHVDHPDLQAVLMEHLPGQPLAEALDQVPLPERDDLWRAVGTSLQSVHEISLADIAGEIRGDQVVPFGDGEGPARGWGTFATGDFLDDTDRLSRHLPSLKVDGDWLAEVMSRAREHLDESPVRLLHNDPTVDNIFVERSEDGWRCSGWIDWEFARHGDPAWDCARLELFREHHVPAPSAAFWKAYDGPNELNLVANQLLVGLFCAGIQFENANAEPGRHAHAIDWLSHLQQHVQRLERLLDAKTSAVIPSTVQGPDSNPGVMGRLRVALRLLMGLRAHDLRAARSYTQLMWSEHSVLRRLLLLAGWSLRQMFDVIPRGLMSVSFADQVKSTPIWLDEQNPHADVPWRDGGKLPERVDTLVIGAGFTGASCAYHWSKLSKVDSLAVLDMGDPATGASGRNEGVVVMGRYAAMVRDTVRPYLDSVRKDLSADDRSQLATQFATVYARAAYRNADLVEATVKKEAFDCDYARNGWIQAREAEDQEALAASVEFGQRVGAADWTALPPDQVLKLGGMSVDDPAGFSQASATFHPARWVWCQLQKALRCEQVGLYTRTKVTRVESDDEGYLVITDRGDIRCDNLINATESYTAALYPHYRDLIHPVQTQAAFGEGGPADMPAEIALSGKRSFFGRHPFDNRAQGLLVGSDATRVANHHAGRNAPSRFITCFSLAEVWRYYDSAPVTLTHEWSGTPGFTTDEYPVVGRLDGRNMWIIGGMCGSGTAVSFNGARHVVTRVLGMDDDCDDYPEAYFAPTRLLDPENHPWPELEMV